MAADALSRYPMDAETQRWGSGLSVIEGRENVCDYGEELRGGEPVKVEP